MENIEKKLGLYCLFNKETKVYDSMYMAFDDKEARDFMLENLSLLAKDLSEKGDLKSYKTFIDRLVDSCVMRLATFDSVQGIFINEQVVLVDYFTEQALIDYYKSKEELQNKFKKVEENK